MESYKINTRCTIKITELLNAIYQKDIPRLRRLCIANVTWFYNSSCIGDQSLQLVQILNDVTYGAQKCRVKCSDYVLHYAYVEVQIISCNYEVEVYRSNVKRSYCYELLVVYNQNKIVVAKINEKQKQYPIYEIKSGRDDIYFRDEREILYLETMHNHVIWHCVNENIMERNSFSVIENKMSSNFVQIHRCYIINIMHIKRIQDYEILMVNGDRLPIPRKRYAEIKSKLEECIKTGQF